MIVPSARNANSVNPPPATAQILVCLEALIFEGPFKGKFHKHEM